MCSLFRISQFFASVIICAFILPFRSREWRTCFLSVAFLCFPRWRWSWNILPGWSSWAGTLILKNLSSVSAYCSHILHSQLFLVGLLLLRYTQGWRCSPFEYKPNVLTVSLQFFIVYRQGQYRCEKNQAQEIKLNSLTDLKMIPFGWKTWWLNPNQKYKS